MAAYVETDEGAVTQQANGGSEIVNWLKAENLSKLIPLFEGEEMTLDELMEFAADKSNFEQYLKELKIPKASIFRILSKIKKRKQSTQKKHNYNPPKAVVVITEKEQNVMESLNKRNRKITALITELAECDAKISENEQVITSKINQEYNNLIHLIRESQKSVLNKLRDISTKKKLNISAKSQQLQQQQNNTKNAIKSCNELLYDVNIDRNQRQNKIFSMVNAVLTEVIPQNVEQFPTDIILVFNKERISSFLSDLMDVYGAQRHPVPVIDDIKCGSIATKECTVCWNAVLSQQDLKKEIRTKLYMKIENVNAEIDEKEREQLDSDLIDFNKNQQNYKYEMNGLKKDTLYKMEIVLFEGKENDNNNNIKQRKDVKPFLFNFKTLTYDFYEKTFVYQTDYDKNGICYFLGTAFGQQPVWQNPAKTGFITLNSSEWSGDINCMVGRTVAIQVYAHHQQDAWVTINFGNKLKINPNAYTLKHCDNHTGHYYLRNWKFEGSNDGSTWSLIKQHTNDTSLCQNSQSYTWRIENCNEYYQQFRIQVTGKDSNGHYHLMGSRFEVYGFLTGNK